MTIIRIALVLTVAACGGGASTSTKPAHGALHNVDDANGCRPVYAEYERRWRIARTQELAGLPGAPSPEVIEDIVSAEVETLPDPGRPRSPRPSAQSQCAERRSAVRRRERCRPGDRGRITPP
jgi:hypothetical protein